MAKGRWTGRVTDLTGPVERILAARPMVNLARPYFLIPSQGLERQPRCSWRYPSWLAPTLIHPAAAAKMLGFCDVGLGFCKERRMEWLFRFQTESVA